MNANYFQKKSTCKSTQFSVCREWPLGDFYLIDQDNKLVGLVGRDNPLSFGSDQLRALRMANQIKAGAPYHGFDVEVVRTNFGIAEILLCKAVDEVKDPISENLSRRANALAYEAQKLYERVSGEVFQGKVIECEEFAVKDNSPTPSRDSLSL
ncbi:hypothetical protein G6355_12220 [Vibrio cholerae]|uniref:hypothetical protein n=1 Tax=Vibrio cholerae TaxID=666 RepID=UPI002F3414F7